MTNFERYNDVEVEGERFRITRMPAQDAIFLFSLRLKSSEGKTVEQLRDESDYKDRLCLRHCFRLREAGGQLLPTPLNLDPGAKVEDPLLWEPTKQVQLVAAAFEYCVVDPMIAGLPEEGREAFKRALKGLPALDPDASPIPA